MPVSTTETKDIVHPNDRLLRILREHSVKKKLPSVAFWDPDYKPAGGRLQNRTASSNAEVDGGDSASNFGGKLVEGVFWSVLAPRVEFPPNPNFFLKNIFFFAF